MARVLSRSAPRDSRPGLGRDTTVWLQGAIQKSAGQILGSGYQASVHLYATPAGPVVVKKPHESGLLGWLWRYLIRREDSVYARLRGVPGVPRSFGLIDGRYLVLEHIAGPSLRAQETQLHDRERFFELLLETVRAMHGAGVAHGDLKKKDNVIVGPGERPYVIDFGVAWLRRDSRRLLNRFLFQTGKQMDYNAWIKLKYQRRTDKLTAADAALFRPLLLERVARALRIPWQKITLRRPRQRWRAARRAHDRPAESVHAQAAAPAPDRASDEQQVAAAQARPPGPALDHEERLTASPPDRPLEPPEERASEAEVAAPPPNTAHDRAPDARD